MNCKNHIQNYYLLRYSYQSSIGGFDENLEIVTVSGNRTELLEMIRTTLEDKQITHINDFEVEEFEFEEQESIWRIEYQTDGMILNNSVVYKIVEFSL